MLRSTRGELLGILRVEVLLEISSAEGSSHGSMTLPLWRVGGEGRGLLYARRAMNVNPAKRTVRSAIVVRERGSIIGGWTEPCVLIFKVWELGYQCAEVGIRGGGCKVRGERIDSSELGGPENDDLIV